MCGIVGVAGDLSREKCISVIERMNEAIIHRGPDDDGAWAEDGFGFGMRRLSIIDLATGKQPIWDDDAEKGIVFNGEVYNYKELRKDLSSRSDIKWKTESDTETILKSLIIDGEKGINNWNGMFAAAVWDKRSKDLLIVRDRMGVKPLYYYWDGKVLLFASEIKAILASGVAEKRLNKQSVWDYLTYRYVPGPDCIWENIRKLPPGHILHYRKGGEPKEVLYWESDVVADNSEAKSRQETEDEFTRLFLDAVDMRLVASDVPVGVFLSGGLDSSAVAAAAVELGHSNFHTFSIGFADGGYYSELPYAEQMAKHVGAQYHQIVIDRKEFLDLLPSMIFATDEPLADLSAIPVLALSRLAAKHVKVVLSGEGSDEILAGYDFGRAESEWDRARRLQKVPRAALKLGAAVSSILPGSISRRAHKIADQPLEDWNRTALPHITAYFSEAEKQSLFPNRQYADSNRVLRGHYERTRSKDPLQQMLYVYQRDWLVEDLLMKADKSTMAASLEARTPFLDYRLVEWANRQPKSVKVSMTESGEYETKSILRRFCKKRLPKEIIDRPKRGFPDPAKVWLTNGLNEWAADVILAENSRLSAVIDKTAVRQMLENAKAGNDHSADQIWALIVLVLWLKEWSVSF